jgi:predicted lipid-binding transport protein (Tim44 family)
MTQSDQSSLERALDQASPVPDMPRATIHAAAMAAFPSRRPLLDNWGGRFGTLAATLVLGFGAFMGVHSCQPDQSTLSADADAFAEQLLSESF